MSTKPRTPIPITLLTGFLGSGKTTLLLSLLSQLPTPPPRIALLKNELGSLPVDSTLVGNSALAGTKELLNGCLCCNLVGSLEDGLRELLENSKDESGTYGLDRVVIETSGSALPATLVVELKRVCRVLGDVLEVEGVVSVIDCENWSGYSDRSYTAKLQAEFTDLVVLNKWEECGGEARLDEIRDRLGDVLREDTPVVRSEGGWVDVGLVFGIVGGARGGEEVRLPHEKEGHKHGHGGHGEEVDVLNVSLPGEGLVDWAWWRENVLEAAARDETYRIKGWGLVEEGGETKKRMLNWAFGRWKTVDVERDGSEEEGLVGRFTFVLARGEAPRWKYRLQKKLKTTKVVGGEGGAIQVEVVV